jgi:hypothetical protein
MAVLSVVMSANICAHCNDAPAERISTSLQKNICGAADERRSGKTGWNPRDRLAQIQINSIVAPCRAAIAALVALATLNCFFYESINSDGPMSK